MAISFSGTKLPQSELKEIQKEIGIDPKQYEPKKIKNIISQRMKYSNYPNLKQYHSD